MVSEVTTSGNLIRQSNGLEFLYDHTGVFTAKYNNNTYYYRKDLQANIVSLIDNSGESCGRISVRCLGQLPCVVGQAMFAIVAIEFGINAAVNVIKLVVKSYENN